MQSVTLIIDKRLELSTKYKRLLESESNSVIVSKDLITSIKIIQDKIKIMPQNYQIFGMIYMPISNHFLVAI